MYERKVVPKATLDEATANRDAAVARLSAARAALESAKEGVAYTEVRAPYAGVVTKRLVQVGETVSPGTPLMSGLSLAVSACDRRHPAVDRRSRYGGSRRRPCTSTGGGSRRPR